jgi:hypothetical protein
VSDTTATATGSMNASTHTGKYLLNAEFQCFIVKDSSNKDSQWTKEDPAAVIHRQRKKAQGSSRKSQQSSKRKSSSSAVEDAEDNDKEQETKPNWDIESAFRAAQASIVQPEHSAMEPFDNNRKNPKSNSCNNNAVPIRISNMTPTLRLCSHPTKKQYSANSYSIHANPQVLIKKQ